MHPFRLMSLASHNLESVVSSPYVSRCLKSALQLYNSEGSNGLQVYGVVVKSRHWQWKPTLQAHPHHPMRDPDAASPLVVSTHIGVIVLDLEMLGQTTFVFCHDQVAKRLLLS